ncbi:transcription factor TFIIIC subunit TFC4 [Ascoidea rubescens DSM 1968]|uniref:TPR-like protein n=1 Tax=Ascoidea rubescens DSM 1968 TaxID=1344418 RepID=A0A1D2V9Z8_9ASCO|nr:TPR-like protein [Ascoidea rubescens DSM 1968]ODV58375.1 TPR-like protein [Ascoidea rubescens DSM 1968]
MSLGGRKTRRSLRTSIKRRYKEVHEDDGSGFGETDNEFELLKQPEDNSVPIQQSERNKAQSNVQNHCNQNPEAIFDNIDSIQRFIRSDDDDDDKDSSSRSNLSINGLLFGDNDDDDDDVYDDSDYISDGNLNSTNAGNTSKRKTTNKIKKNILNNTNIEENNDEKSDGNENFGDSDFDMDNTGNSDFYDSDDEIIAPNSDSFKNMLRSAGNFKVKSKKKSKNARGSGQRPRKERELEPEVRMLLSQANEAFVQGDMEKAEKLYLDVIKLDAKCYSAYKTIGDIYKQKGDLEGCCNIWFVAAQNNPRDAQFWSNVGELSKELGFHSQAIHCYTRAIWADPKDHKAIYNRALIYKETRQFGKALNGFQKLLELFPSETSIIRELASVYSQQNRNNEAIDMYLNIFNQNRAMLQAENDSIPNFGWSELNILMELYSKLTAWDIGLKKSKQISRWIQNRDDETWWDLVDNDSEFDVRRSTNQKYMSLPQSLKDRENILPIDIRVKFGLFRLNLNDIPEALRHFEFLLEQNARDVSDLNLEVGKALLNNYLYSEALKIFAPLSYIDEFNTVGLVMQLAKCLQETDDYQQAISAYQSVIEIDPENIEAKLALAEIYIYLEDNERSKALLDDINQQRIREKTNSNEEKTREKEGETPKLVVIKKGGIINDNIKMSQKPRKLNEQEKEQREKELTAKNVEIYNRLKRLYPSVENEKNPIAADAWLHLCSELIEHFLNVKYFIPKEKLDYLGNMIKYREGHLDIEERLAKIQQMHDGLIDTIKTKGIFDIEYNHMQEIMKAQLFRGLSFDEWFELFMQYSLFLCLFQKNKRSLEILEIAKNIVIFQNEKNRKLMSLVELSMGLMTNNFELIVTNLRHVLNYYQFSRDAYRLFSLCLPSGQESIDTYISLNHQKYFLRQIKAWDSVRYKKEINGQAKLINDYSNLDISEENPYLIILYGALLYAGKSYAPSLGYFSKIYKRFPNDPLVCLLNGLAHIHRAMQRLTTNRHLQILQGITYIIEYFKIRQDQGIFEYQEALYNLGRTFHLIGLTSIAVELYEKVLSMEIPAIKKESSEYKEDASTFDLKRETAYNLIMIYNFSENYELAAEIMNKYLTI